MKDYRYTHHFICQNCGKECIRKNKDKVDAKKYCSSLCSQKSRIGKKNDKEKKIKKAIASFEKNVIRKEGCWGWKGGLIHGYGYISTKCFGSQRAHRVSYAIHKGEIPNAMHVLHSCHNKSCTNPDHLRVGTQKENMQDKLKSFRQDLKISKNKIFAIKIIIKSTKFSIDEISKIFKISKNSILTIIHQKT